MNEPIKYKWLPSEPTDEMLEAVGSLSTLLSNNNSRHEAYETIYKAMWQAAPEIEQEPVAFISKSCIKWLEEGKPSNCVLTTKSRSSGVVPIYTHPQPSQSEQSLDMVKRKPLS